MVTKKKGWFAELLACDSATAASSRRASSSTPSFGGVRVAGGGDEGAGSGGSGCGTWSAVTGVI